MEGQNDEKILLEQLVSYLNGKDENELAELDRALGIDKLVQVRRMWEASGPTGGTERPSWTHSMSGGCRLTDVRSRSN